MDDEMLRAIGRLEGKMDLVIERIQKGDECMKSQGDRIGALENFRALLLGEAAVLTLVITVSGYWVMRHFFGG